MNTSRGNGFLFLGVALFIFGIFLLFQRWNPAHVTFARIPETVKTGSSLLTPSEITIKSVHIDLPIIPAKIHNHTWDLSAEGVSYLESSPIPGDRGNSILYGHNWQSLLGPLTHVKPGDDISITFTNRTTRHFTVMYITRVNPSDVQILAPTNDKRITIYTCTGFLDTKRLVVTALAHE